MYWFQSFSCLSVFSLYHHNWPKGSQSTRYNNILKIYISHCQSNPAKTPLGRTIAQEEKLIRLHLGSKEATGDAPLQSEAFRLEREEGRTKKEQPLLTKYPSKLEVGHLGCEVRQRLLLYLMAAPPLSLSEALHIASTQPREPFSYKVTRPPGFLSGIRLCRSEMPLQGQTPDLFLQSWLEAPTDFQQWRVVVAAGGMQPVLLPLFSVCIHSRCPSLTLRCGVWVSFPNLSPS